MKSIGEVKEVSLTQILDGVCQQLDVDKNILLTGRRDFEYVHARRFYIALASSYTRESLRVIAEELNQTHAMTYHHKHKHNDFMETDKQYAREYMLIEQAVIPSELLGFTKQKDMIDTLMVRNAKLQNELLELKDRAAILELKLARVRQIF